MAEVHDQLGPFLDGELSAADAEAFRQHLAECATCQQDLQDFTALDAVAGVPAQEPRPVVVATPAPQRRSLRPLAWSGALLAASLAAFVVYTKRPPPEPPALALAPVRQLEARLTWSEADTWRPYGVDRAAGAAGEPVSAAKLASLEAAGDTRALAGAWLLAGNAGRARALLAGLDASLPDVASDAAAVALSEGRFEDALTLAQAALDARPDHPQAAWNRALALERLGLGLSAAAAYRALAARAEPGWSTEASHRADALETSWKRGLAASQAALDAAARMTLAGEPMPVDVALAMPSWSRMNLRYALLTATSRAQVEALRPLARALDAALGGHVLDEAVTHTAAQDFAKRARWAKGVRGLLVDYYRALVAWGFGPAVDDAEPGLGDGTARLIAELRAAKAWDYLVVVLPMGRALGQAFEDYVKAAQVVGDPWFTLGVDMERARRATSVSWAKGEEAFLELLPRTATAPQRALEAHEALANLYVAEHRLVEGTSHALAALRLAQAQGEWKRAGMLLPPLADSARFRNATAVASAFLEEWVLRMPEDCAAQAYRHESLAAMAVVDLDMPRARRELDAMPTCDGEPLSVAGLSVLADLARLDPQPDDVPRFEAALAKVRDAEAAKGVLQHLHGRLLLDSRPAEGAALLREAMTDGDPATGAKVRAYGFGLLRSAAGEASRWDEVFSLTEEEAGVTALSCALVVEVQDNRVVAAARGATGAAFGAAKRFPLGRRSGGLSLDEISQVAAPLAQEAAKGCAKLAVFAGYPLHGRAGWLPDDVAWTYSGGGKGTTPRSTTALVVRDVATPPALGLPRLASWDDAPAPGDVELSRDAATPSRVKAAMRDVGLVEIHAHAQVNAAESDTAAILLAPDTDGSYTLSAAELEHVTLDGAPVVVLAACRASSVAAYLHEPWSLPRALLHAGASAVIAAPVDLPDGEARAFFQAVVRRLRRGEDAATAVRDERVSFTKQHPAPWVRTVLVFD